jgi:hypothetical protein
LDVAGTSRTNSIACAVLVLTWLASLQTAQRAVQID